ncbi:MAG: phospholipase D-like domain-containing protein [Actinomycetota bacterium]|nr:phospholipase D-like domain-containing protein [Actinomycetota bacterium]
MSPEGGELFIVDNSDSGWTGLRYLKDWTEIAKSFDIATGFFEIGSLLGLDGSWQQLDKIRILMGAEVTHSTKAAFLKATKGRAEAMLDASLEDEKRAEPFLHGVSAIVEALKSGQIECRVYTKDKFHAKAYITHAKLEVVGPRALVGSSNFTRPGLTQNVELNIQVQTGPNVALLQKWFNEHWQQAQDVTPEMLEVVDRHVREYSPFQVYAKALHEFFRGHEITAGEWDESESRMFHELDRYQQEAYWSLMKIARQHGGAFLCDGVGLGKTFVGLMLIERLILHEGKRVVLFAPKATKEAVWEPLIRHYLPHIGGMGGGGDFSNLAMFSHTDLGRKGSFPARFARITELADAVIIDEAHHFRNPGTAGTTGDEDKESRYRKLFNLLDPEIRPKSLFLLTATPINNRLTDFRHMTELFSRGDDRYFAQTLGINNLRAHFGNLEKTLRKEFEGHNVAEAGAVVEAQEILATSPTFQELVVQRSRAYAVASQLRETGTGAAFPERKPPQVAEYSIKKTYGQLLDDVEAAFSRAKPLFSLAIYYPLAYYKGTDESIDPIENNRQYQVVGLIRTNFLKRFESSVWAFEQSCDRLFDKLLAFVQVHSETEAEKKRLERWKLQNAEILGYAAQLSLRLAGEPDEEADEDVVPQELLDKVIPLDREEYKVDEILDETFLDLDQIVDFLEETQKFDAKRDDKLQKLIRLLKSKDLERRKVLIFSEFSDTARYIAQHLDEAGIDGLEQLDSGSKKNRADVITRFSPYYNGSSSPELEAEGKSEIRVLVSTDVLSEGLNLQDATRMINYDIHWNPVRLMQRIGRVDRRMSPDIEAQLRVDHPEKADDRGTVVYWNFLPPDELNAILTLYTKVTQKTLLISKTMGIEGRKLFRPEDDYEALKEFNQAYEGTTSAVEQMHLEYQRLLDEIPGLAETLERLPGAVFSGKQRPKRGLRGAFFCFGLPALDKEKGEFTDEAGTTRWYFYDAEREAILEEPAEIVDSIRSAPEIPRSCTTEESKLLEMRDAVLKHIKNTYLKRVDAPVGVAPRLRCWMELNGG